MKKALKYISCFENSGYGLAGRGYIEALHELKAELTWQPIGFSQKTQKYEIWTHAVYSFLPSYENSIPQKLLGKKIDYSSVLVHAVPETWPKFFEKGKCNIGMTVWETDRLPDHWPELINQADHVIVPSQFNKEVFLSSGITKPITVIPHVPRIYTSNLSEEIIDEYRELYGIQKDDFVFYSINTWSARKALWDLVRIYLHEFRADEKVVLILKTSRMGPENETGTIWRPTEYWFDQFLEAHEDPPDTFFINSELSEEEIEVLHRISNCFVTTTHSEGFGLGCYDAASAGNPVIATGWGGQLDFLPGEFSYHINYSMDAVVDTLGAMSYQPHQRWASADEKHTAKLMRHVFNNREESRIKGEQNKIFIDKNFNRKKIAEQIQELIQ